MEYSAFSSLCKYLGDQTKAESERWKSIKYINIAGQASPPFDCQTLIKEKKIALITNESKGPGFIIQDYPNPDMGVTGLNKEVINFIPISTIDSITFITDDKQTTIDDIVKNIPKTEDYTEGQGVGYQVIDYLEIDKIITPGVYEIRSVNKTSDGKSKYESGILTVSVLNADTTEVSQTLIMSKKIKSRKKVDNGAWSEWVISSDSSSSGDSDWDSDYIWEDE